MDIEELVKDIRAEIFRLALQSPDLETMHWYIALDDCFENDEFYKDAISNIVWRCQVLSWKKQPVTHLTCMIDNLFKKAGYNVEAGEDIMKPLKITPIKHYEN